VTHDYGQTWSDVATTLPHETPARVIREDPVRKDLLFAGTEYGLWISFDGGKQWQSFQHGVPVTPISAMLVYHDDPIVATEGRGFWVLDDMASLRQLTPAVASERLHLFTPTAAVRLSAGARSGGLGGSAMIRYSLDESSSDSLRLDIVDDRGVTVRHVSS